MPYALVMSETAPALLALLTAFASGLAFPSIENKLIGVGIYSAMATMTTVGYGDIVPTAAAGRAVAVVVMLVGSGFYALVIGAVSERFASAARSINESAVDLTESDVLKEELSRIVNATYSHLSSRLKRPHLTSRAGGAGGCEGACAAAGAGGHVRL